MSQGARHGSVQRRVAASDPSQGRQDLGVEVCGCEQRIARRQTVSDRYPAWIIGGAEGHED